MQALAISIAAVTALIFAPVWVQHLFAKDAGLLALGGGKLTEADIFGDKRTPAMHPMIFHTVAVCAVMGFGFSFIAIAATAFNDVKTIKKVVFALYVAFMGFAAAVQYTHPWTGSPPASFFEMPMPVMLVGLAAVSIGYAFDNSAAAAKGKKK